MHFIHNLLFVPLNEDTVDFVEAIEVDVTGLRLEVEANAYQTIHLPEGNWAFVAFLSHINDAYQTDDWDELPDHLFPMCYNHWQQLTNPLTKVPDYAILNPV